MNIYALRQSISDPTCEGAETRVDLPTWPPSLYRHPETLKRMWTYNLLYKDGLWTRSDPAFIDLLVGLRNDMAFDEHGNKISVDILAV